MHYVPQHAVIGPNRVLFFFTYLSALIETLTAAGAAMMAGIGMANAQSKPEDVKTFTLGNGMKFLVLEDHSIPNANMYLFWKVGSRNEVHGITGLSHFF